MLSIRVTSQLHLFRSFRFKNNSNNVNLANSKCLSFYSNRIQKLKNEQKLRLQNKKENLKLRLKEKENLVKLKLEGFKENIFTIPNGLTTSRILMTPFLGYFILNNHYHLAFCTFTLAGITDLVIMFKFVNRFS